MRPRPGPFTLLLAFSFVGMSSVGCDNKKEEPDILECTGSCFCDADTRTCTCEGGTDCVLEGDADDVTFECEGNATCELTCGVSCHVVCPGTAGCIAYLGDESTAICNGTGTCTYTCDGDCSVDCPGSSQCTLDCPVDATCEITSCPQAEDCGDGLLACRTACPLP